MSSRQHAASAGIQPAPPNAHAAAIIFYIANARMQVGFCTLYTFWAYPDRSRLRVSQVLTLPLYQRQGVAQGLLQAAYDLADLRGVLDVTVRLVGVVPGSNVALSRYHTNGGVRAAWQGC